MKKKGFVEIGIIAVTFLILIVSAAFATHLSAGSQLSFFNQDIIEFTYTAKYRTEPLSFGIEEFKSQEPQFTCSYQGNKLDSDETQNSCWKIQAKYQGNHYELINGKKMQLDNYLSVTPIINAKMQWDQDESTYVYDHNSDWTVIYEFELKKPNLKISITLPADQLKLNSNLDAMVTVYNPWISFDKTNSGIWHRYHHKFLERAETWQTVQAALASGTTSHLMTLEVTELGKIEHEFQPYFTIQADPKITIAPDIPEMTYYEVFKELPEHSPGEEKGKWALFIDWIKDRFNQIFRWSQ